MMAFLHPCRIHHPPHHLHACIHFPLLHRPVPLFLRLNLAVHERCCALTSTVQVRRLEPLPPVVEMIDERSESWATKNMVGCTAMERVPCSFRLIARDHQSPSLLGLRVHHKAGE